MSFRKIVAHLAYSPAMIWHLANYDAKIKVDRKNNLKIILFAILNLLIIAMVLSVNNSVNTNSTNLSLSNSRLWNFSTDKTVLTIDEAFRVFETKLNLTTIYQYFGISKDNVSKMAIINSPTPTQNCFEISHSPINSLGKININSEISVQYSPCLSQYYGRALTGTGSSGDFVILDNGNLLINNVVKNTTSDLSFSIDVVNSTTNKHVSVINPNDSVKYTLTATNQTNNTVTDVVKIKLGDIAEYARILNNDISQEQTLKWHIDGLAPQNSLTYTIYVKFDRKFSQKALNLNSPDSQDCIATLAIGDAITKQNVACSVLKNLELAISQHIQPSKYDNKILIGILLGLLIIIVLKALQIARINFISKEIRIIRHKINQGGI